LKLYSIAFPAISTGVFGFPKEQAAMVIIRAIRNYFEKQPTTSLKTIRIVLFDPASFNAFKKAANSILNKSV
jgi:histone H2A